jgi:hypothetical protein
VQRVIRQTGGAAAGRLAQIEVALNRAEVFAAVGAAGGQCALACLLAAQLPFDSGQYSPAAGPAWTRETIVRLPGPETAVFGC